MHIPSWGLGPFAYGDPPTIITIGPGDILTVALPETFGVVNVLSAPQEVVVAAAAAQAVSLTVLVRDSAGVVQPDVAIVQAEPSS